MSVTVLSLFPDNETSSFIETSTGRDNFTYGNYSDDGTELKGDNASSPELWVNLEAYKYSFWGIVLFITVIGTIGNILVFIMMGDTKLRHLSYSVYLKCLAVSDSWLLILRLIHETERLYLLGQPAELKLSVCALSFLSKILSPWLIIGLTLDRYVCVCFPLRRGMLCTRPKAIAICSTMFGLSVVLSLPFPFTTELIRGDCFPTEEVMNYFIFIRLCTSILPCIVILVLNILIIIQIQRSQNFRNTFTRSTTNPSSRQQDSSTRPLVLVSVMAFVTLIPVAMSEAVIVSIRLLSKDFEAVASNGTIWSIFFLIYLLNFGQNFYILIGSSSNYRHIIRKRLRCFTLTWNHVNRPNKAMVTDIPSNTSGSGLGTTGLSMVSITSGNIN